MKLTIKLLALFFGVLVLANAANAESPREQFKQMVEQLQKSSDDDALREKIIKLAHKLKPALSVPEEAERRMARGTAAFKGAKSVADYSDAVKEFEQATLAAPWYGDAYFNLGVAQDKAENYEAALRSLKLAQLASPEVKEIKALIYEVEYRKEREASPEVQAAKRKQQEQETRRAEEDMIRGLEGAEFYTSNSVFDQAHFLRIRGGKVEYVNRQASLPGFPGSGKYCLCSSNECRGPIGEEMVCHRALIIGRIGEYHPSSSMLYRYEISRDGSEILHRCLGNDGQDYCGLQRFVRR